MALPSILAKRLAMGLVAAWSVLTTVFLAFTVTDDWVAKRIRGRISFGMSMGGASREEVEQAVQEALAEYTAARGLDRPLHVQYLDWMTGIVRLEWGQSFRTGEPVFPLVIDATKHTAMYLIPGVLVGVLFGALVGVVIGLSGRPPATATRIGAYLLFALPSFWVGGLLFSAARGDVIDPHPLLFEVAVPALLVTFALLGSYASYVRAYTRDYTSSEFARQVRGVGGSHWDVARHAVRNAAIPLFSTLFLEVAGLLALSIFVIEMVFGIEGLGLTMFRAFDARDFPVILGCMLVVIWVGILGNIVQDVSYEYLDPRV